MKGDEKWETEKDKIAYAACVAHHLGQPNPNPCYKVGVSQAEYDHYIQRWQSSGGGRGGSQTDFVLNGIIAGGLIVIVGVLVMEFLGVGGGAYHTAPYYAGGYSQPYQHAYPQGGYW